MNMIPIRYLSIMKLQTHTPYYLYVYRINLIRILSQIICGIWICTGSYFYLKFYQLNIYVLPNSDKQFGSYNASNVALPKI